MMRGRVTNALLALFSLLDHQDLLLFSALLYVLFSRSPLLYHYHPFFLFYIDRWLLISEV